MELSTVRNPILHVTPASCRFALHPIVPLSAGMDGDREPLWNEALLRPGAGSESASTEDLVEALYADASLETDIAIFRRVTSWLNQQRLPQRISINIHPDSLTRRTFVVAALEVLRETQETGHSICLELVEFGYCGDRQGMVQNANLLRHHGALIALDDFGSKLNFFDMCAAGIVDIIKIDVSVADGIDRCTNRQAIAMGIKTLADGLGAQVVAEGIETRPQLATLQEIGVSYGQGYLFQKPIIEEGI